jgi:hypothetical protein
MKESTNENNTNELLNPRPKTIPNIVWDNLNYSQKEEIINAVKLNYTITYYHTGHRGEKDIKLSDDSKKRMPYTGLEPEDTDVIEIIGVDSSVKESVPVFSIQIIYSKATSDHESRKLENPEKDIIPYYTWDNLHDIHKQEIINIKNNLNDNNFEISYNPEEGTIAIHFNIDLVGYIYIYDAKQTISKYKYISID